MDTPATETTLTSPQCVFVLGVECSGTRLVKSIFAANGYFGGVDHYEEFGNHPDQYSMPLPSVHPAIVWRFSYPMGDHIPRVDVAAYLAQRGGYEAVCVIVVRDGFPSIKHSDTEERSAQTSGEQSKLLAVLFQQVVAMNCQQVRIVTYESLIKHGVSVFHGIKLAIPLVNCPELRDENTKWYVNL